ncbi:hypothetical protein BX070DRAFT_229879 [Coemansia spiralis]|nr:hypothetical protein BX070DRAFT_229879 [Coemansia spiralis]
MDGASDDEEERILAIVHMAERCQLDCADPPKKCAISAQFNAKSNTEADNIQKKPQQQQSHWTEGEWRQWAEYVTAVPKMPRLEQDEMAQRLDAVHELQDGAWQHGYRDTVLDNGKLQRTYATQPVVVQAYPDGNVKRTAGGAVITLYYANGDWSCTVPGRCCYYYYSEERVWHEQHDDGRTAERPCT